MKGKTCTMCNQFKEWSEFNLNPTGKDGSQCKCRNCQKIMNKIYYEKRKQKPKERLLPFVYQPRAPYGPVTPDPNNLIIEEKSSMHKFSGSFSHHFQ